MANVAPPSVNQFFRDPSENDTITRVPRSFVKADAGYKPSTFRQNFIDEFWLGPVGRFAEIASRPTFQDDPDFNPFAQENLSGYEAYASEFLDSKSAEQQNYIKSIIDEQNERRERLRGTGSWAPGIVVGVLDPINLAPIPLVKGIGFIRGAAKGGTTIGALTLGQEALLQNQSIDLPLTESAFAVGGSVILGGILSGAVGSFGRSIDIEGTARAIDDAQARYDLKSATSNDPTFAVGPVRSQRNGERIMAKYDRENDKITLDTEMIEDGFSRKVWANPRIAGVDPLPDNAINNLDDWFRFVIEHELAHSRNPQKPGQTRAAYENEMNQIALKKLRELRFSNQTTMSPVVSQEASRLPSGSYSVKDAADAKVLRFTPHMRMTGIADELGGDNFLAGNAFELTDNGMIIKGAADGIAKPMGVAHMVEQQYGMLPGRTIEAIDDLWNQSLGAQASAPSTTGVNWSAKRRQLVDTVTFNRGPNTREQFYSDVAVRQAVESAERFEQIRGYPPSRFVDEAQELLNETYFKRYAEDGTQAGVFGMTPQVAKTRISYLDGQIARKEALLDARFQRYEDRVQTIADLEQRAREGFRQGLSSKQYDLYLKLTDEVTPDSAFARTTADISNELARLRRERIYLDQFVERGGVMPPNEVRYFPRFFRLESIQKYEKELKAILTDHFNQNPFVRVWDDTEGWIEVGTNPATVSQRVEATISRLKNEARLMGADGIVNTERTGSGLRYLQHRQLDIPNEKLLGVQAADGTRVDFIETDLDMIIRNYSNKMAPQIVMAQRFGDRFMEGRRAEIREYYIDKYIDPLLDKLKTAKGAEVKKLNKEIDRHFDRLERYLDNHRDVRDRVLNQFDIADPSAISTRVAEGLRNWTSLAYSGMFLVSSLPDLARPMMAYGFRNMVDVVGAKYFDMSAWKFATKEMQEVSGIFADMVNNSGMRRVVDQGDMAGMGKRTAFERGLQTLQGPAYLANLLTPWTYKIKQWTGLIAQHLIVKYSVDLANGTISKANLSMLSNMGINESAARRIAQMPYQRSGKAYLMNVTDWDDEALKDLVGSVLTREIERVMILPNVGDKPNIMSGVFRVKNPAVKKALDSDLAKLFGFSRVGDRAQNPAFGLPFQFLAWPIAATTKVGAEALQRRDAAAFYGAMSMIGFGYLSGWIKDPGWSDRTLEQQVIRAVELSGVAGMVTDVPLMIEEMSMGNYGLRAMLGYDSLYPRDEGDIIGRIGGASMGLAFDVRNAVFNDELRASERGALVRRSLPFAGLFYMRDVSKWGQKNFINPLFE